MSDDSDLDRTKAERDRKDFNDELAGRDTGRMPRFLGHEEHPSSNRDQEKRATELLWRVALTTEADLQRFRERLGQLDRASLETYRHAHAKATMAEHELNELRSRASLDEHGRLVFRTADGRSAFLENGNELSREELDRTDWSPGAPTWENWQASTDRARRSHEELQSVVDYRSKLQEARERVDSPSPLTLDELDQLNRDLDALPASVKRSLDGATASNAAAADRALPNAPQIREAFDKSASRPADSAPEVKSASVRPILPTAP